MTPLPIVLAKDDTRVSLGRMDISNLPPYLDGMVDNFFHPCPTNCVSNVEINGGRGQMPPKLHTMWSGAIRITEDATGDLWMKSITFSGVMVLPCMRHKGNVYQFQVQHGGGEDGHDSGPHWGRQGRPPSLMA